jgi:uncharacterized SAM-binding protein YcdF (DUF218 family)
MAVLSYVTISLLLLTGSIVTVNSVILNITTNLNLGNVLQLLLGIVLLVYGLFFKRINRLVPLWIRLSFAGVLVAFIIFALSLIAYGVSDNVTYDEDAIVVLGAGLNGKEPGTALKGRLDAALEYRKNNPDVMFVVSGGQGPQEDTTEADAMAIYLIERGVYPKYIIFEEESTSTRENFQFSKQKLDTFFQKEYKVAYVTNEYHIYRAGIYAKQAGFENASHLHSNTRIGGLLSSCLRECLANLKLRVVGK